MRAYKIPLAGKRIIQRASSQSIEDYFVRSRKQLRTQTWLSVNNRYRRRCTVIFDADCNTAGPFTAYERDQLTAYIGASAPAHAIDGWSFLGRAVGSSLRGDYYSACHFAYYAELRAAMSLLATEGIGIFSRNHAVVNDADIHIYPARKGTHTIVWPLLKYWSSLNRAEDLIDDLVQPEQIALSHWLRELNPAAPVRAVGRRWLSTWGLDLENTFEDHSIRNLASYRPSEFRYPRTMPAVNIANFVMSMWSFFEPSEHRRFPQIERFLLKSAVQQAGTSRVSIASLEQVGLTSDEASNWNDFLMSNDQCALLTSAERSSRIEDSECHLRVISRACLLLFLASSSARRMLVAAGYSQEKLARWWHRVGIDRGLWSPGDIPDDHMDTWADAELAIDEMRNWIAHNPNASLRELRHNQQGAISILSSLERIGIWSLVP